jgi:hypothetical protein
VEKTKGEENDDYENAQTGEEWLHYGASAVRRRMGDYAVEQLSHGGRTL